MDLTVWRAFNRPSLLFAIFLLATCEPADKSATNRVSHQSGVSGEQLANYYCSSCHAFPKADILPRNYWGRVLPIMGFFLGAGKDRYMFADYLNPVAKKRLLASGIFPETPQISADRWKAIEGYYFHNSPLELPEVEVPDIDLDLHQFNVERLPWKSTHEGLSYLNFKDGLYEIGFYSETESFFLKIDDYGQEVKRIKTAYPLVDVNTKDKELLLLMGKLNNIDEPTGTIVLNAPSIQYVIKDLERPISFEVEDFDNDGTDDFLVAEFGKFLGGVNIYSMKDTICKVNVHPSSGAVKTIVRDVNNDGLKDFYVLVTQADESVYLFTNKGNFNFDKQRLFRLPAHYGTTNFEVLDFDGDGDEDVICSSGDSGDFGIIEKPFHGVRVFENLGANQYKEAWFYAQQGAYGTASADYDNDGDIDIASIGYFAAYFDRDKEVFIYFENQSSKENKWKFVPHGIKGNPDDCWILINIADVDGDSDLDIILGANSKVLDTESKASKLKEWQHMGGMVTILRNNMIK